MAKYIRDAYQYESITAFLRLGVNTKKPHLHMANGRWHMVVPRSSWGVQLPRVSHAVSDASKFVMRMNQKIRDVELAKIHLP